MCIKFHPNFYNPLLGPNTNQAIKSQNRAKFVNLLSLHGIGEILLPIMWLSLLASNHYFNLLALAPIPISNCSPT